LPGGVFQSSVLVDDTDAYVLTQSFNALAARSPASIVKSDSETAALKIDSYKALWLGASPIS